MRKKELLGSAIPARALYLVWMLVTPLISRWWTFRAYQAMKAARIPNAPPAMMQPSCGAGLSADWPPLTR